MCSQIVNGCQTELILHAFSKLSMTFQQLCLIILSMCNLKLYAYLERAFWALTSPTIVSLLLHAFLHALYTLQERLAGLRTVQKMSIYLLVDEVDVHFSNLLKRARILSAMYLS